MPPISGVASSTVNQVPAAVVKRVVVMVQENHTVDSYFRGLAPYGGNVATGWPTATNPPASDPPHDRQAYFEWLTGASTGAHVQFDTGQRAPVLPVSGLDRRVRREPLRRIWHQLDPEAPQQPRPPVNS